MNILLIHVSQYTIYNRITFVQKQQGICTYGKSYNLHLYKFQIFSIVKVWESISLWSIGRCAPPPEASFQVTPLLCHAPPIWPCMEEKGHEEIWSHSKTAGLIPNWKSGRMIFFILQEHIFRGRFWIKIMVTQVYACLNFGLPLQRSRHSSGQSVTSLRAMRTNSQEGLKKRPVLTPTDSPVNQQKQPREELWHIDLRHTFLRQYIKYVQSLGFISVTLLPSLHSKGYIL